MTKNKRFTFTQDTLAKADVFDGDEFVCCTLSVWVEQLVDLLNELAEENLELRKIIEDGIEVSQSEIDEELRRRKMSENKRLWYIMCYCDDKIEAENEDEAYKIFCEKHHFEEDDAEFVSYGRVDDND